MEAFEYNVLMERKGAISDGARNVIHLNPRVELTDWHNHWDIFFLECGTKTRRCSKSDKRFAN